MLCISTNSLLEQSMASYIQETLIQGENLQYSGHISLWPYILHLILGSLCVLSIGGVALFGNLPIVPSWVGDLPYLLKIGILALGLLTLIFVFMMYESTELAVTDRRVIVKVGVIQRNTSELYLTRVEGVQVEQTILGRMFNFGTVVIKGVGTEIAPVSNVYNPLEFRRQFFSAADKGALAPTDTLHPGLPPA